MSIAQKAAQHILNGRDVHSTVANFVQSVNRLTYEEKVIVFQEFKDALKNTNCCSENNLIPQVRIDIFRALKSLNLHSNTHQAILNVLGKN